MTNVVNKMILDKDPNYLFSFASSKKLALRMEPLRRSGLNYEDTVNYCQALIDHYFSHEYKEHRLAYAAIRVDINIAYIHIFTVLYTAKERQQRIFQPDDIWLGMGHELHFIPRSDDPVEIKPVQRKYLRTLEDADDCTLDAADTGVRFGYSVIKAATCLDTYEWLALDIGEYWNQCYHRCEGIHSITQPNDMGLVVDMDPSFINAMATVCGKNGVPLWYKLKGKAYPVEIVLCQEK